MSGKNGHATPPAEGATPAVETKDDATKKDAVDTEMKEAPAAESKAAVESRAEPAAAADSTKEAEKPAEASSEKPAEQTEDNKSDVEMADAAAPVEPAPEGADAGASAGADQADQAAADAADAASGDADKSKSRRKSIGGGAAKGKKLNKKASKPRMLNLDAEPGDHYFVKLKGFPQWPVIICDEDMLPASLLKSRPVTAKRADGTYREDYADGGKNVADRTFPVMYLHTNEFGWVPNTELIKLDPETVLDVKLDKMRKTLQAAHHLASENHPLSYYKEVLQNYQEELIEQEKAKAAKAATPKGKKSKALSEDDDDVDMEDAPDVDETPAKDKKAKKRKAEDSAETPRRSDSVKKPKIKLTTSATPKTANGATATPKSTKATDAKSSKSKSKKKDADDKDAEEAAAAKETEQLSAEDKHTRKSVLKAILKLETFLKRDEFKSQPRSQVLLDKWNKLLAVDGTPTAPAAEHLPLTHPKDKAAEAVEASA
ncbi:hypothetical protein CHGG_02827 [Chaetomium globosum CBS 148.51]|uniref:PWWP domain-containing protein n=1 Tax=Chaetomium globosum (strain ATCC 6205 / CBS 148.51 / DSM 1962 / NBRC 6347 / NRRL 1970) TaxID=306901 RepID=Q2HAC7_CHAGB|nr:uncharacterized protein CHGG_02827 [Chaetomium globosum CBS 148.51]EAQ90892.1 hypothetical protein CHGG_02827 [Chaetomium globosum CBS 148.51]